MKLLDFLYIDLLIEQPYNIDWIQTPIVAKGVSTTRPSKCIHKHCNQSSMKHQLCLSELVTDFIYIRWSSVSLSSLVRSIFHTTVVAKLIWMVVFLSFDFHKKPLLEFSFLMNLQLSSYLHSIPKSNFVERFKGTMLLLKYCTWSLKSTQKIKLPSVVS